MQHDGHSWYHGIPTSLRDKMVAPGQDLVDYVTLGLGGYYFVQFCDGSKQWAGPDSLSAALRDGWLAFVELLVFAPNNGWYLLWEDLGFA